MTRDPGCSSPLTMIFVLAINSLTCGVIEKAAMKYYDKKQKKKNRHAATAITIASNFIVSTSMLCVLLLAFLIPSAAASPIINNNNNNNKNNNNATAITVMTASNHTAPFNILLDPQITPHTQSCKCHQQGLVYSYNIHIGELHNEGAHCVALHSAVSDASFALVTMFRCNNDGNGDTTLHFNVLGLWMNANLLNRKLAKICVSLDSGDDEGIAERLGVVLQTRCVQR